MHYSRHAVSVVVACVLAAASTLLTGCGRSDIETYRVSKTQSSQTMAAQGHGHAHGHDDPVSAAPLIEYATPSGWEELAPGEMRAASFRVQAEDQESADVGVFPLPGMAGGDLGNVNRWRGQVGLSPIDEAELAKAAEAVSVGEEEGQLYDIAGTTPGTSDKTRILAVILRRDGMAWFFKMTGNDNLVATQKPAFKEFLKSVRFVKPTGLPPSHPPIDMASAAPVAHGDMTHAHDKPEWTVPGSWKEASPGQFLEAKYVVSGENGATADINVSVSAGEGGGVAGNVNRWRGQLGLEVLPPEQLNLEKIQTDAGAAVLTTLTGKDARTGKTARLIGAVVPQEGKTWFYKLMGDEALVEREKDAFIQFIKTAKY